MEPNKDVVWCSGHEWVHCKPGGLGLGALLDFRLLHGLEQVNLHTFLGLGYSVYKIGVISVLCPVELL